MPQLSPSEEIDMLKAIGDKHGVTPGAVLVLCLALMALNYGRTPKTVSLLRAVADILESEAGRYNNSMVPMGDTVQ